MSIAFCSPRIAVNQVVRFEERVANGEMAN